MKVTQVAVDAANGFAMATECMSYTLPKAKRVSWLKTRELYLGETNMGTRVMTPVIAVVDERTAIRVRQRALDLPEIIKYIYKKVVKKKVVYLMDVITGSLYSIENKRCMSSDTLKLISYKIDPAHGKTLLFVKVAGLK
jgi:hypothetical protein